MMLLPLALQPHIMGKDLPYKGPEDLTIVQQIYSRANILAVSAKSPWKSLGDLVNDLKSGNKKEFTYAGRGVGNAEHLTMEMFARVAGIQGKVKVVPFQNDGEGTAAVLGGHVDGTAFMFASVKPNVIDGQLRPLATFMPFAGMEQFGIKSMKQLGYDLECSPRHYIIAPKGLPKDILAKVDDAFKKGAND